MCVGDAGVLSLNFFRLWMLQRNKACYSATWVCFSATRHVFQQHGYVFQRQACFSGWGEKVFPSALSLKEKENVAI
jgi:hypothetical protein